MSASLLGFGAAWPPHELDRARCAELLGALTDTAPRSLAVLLRRSGVERRRVTLDPHDDAGLAAFLREGDGAGPGTARRMALFDTHAPPLAEQAARAALDDAHARPADVTHLVTVSCTGFSAPGLDHALQTRLELDPGVQRTHVGFMGCHGALNGLRVADALVAADPSRRVLLTAVELCSLHVQTAPTESELVANALFGDGAAAVLLGGGEAAPSAPRLLASGSRLLPESAELMSWRIGDAGFRMGLSTRVPEVLHRALRPWLTSWLAEHGAPLDAVGAWAVHPGGPRILGAVEEALDLPREALDASRTLLAARGNMSSPTVLMLLQQLARADAPRPWVALAFGPGLSAEVALVGQQPMAT